MTRTPRPTVATPSPRRGLTRFVSAALVIVMLAAQTPAAPLVLAGTASRWRSGLAFWFESSGWAETLRGVARGQGRPAARGQERQAERDARARRLAISPSNFTARTGETVRFAAVAYDQNGNTVGGVGFRWGATELARNRRAGISRDGEFTPRAPGAYRITADGAGHQAQTIVNVIDGGQPRGKPNPSGGAVPKKNVSTRDLPPPPAQGRPVGSKPRRGAGGAGQATIVKTSFASPPAKRRPSAPPPAQNFWGDTHGWNNTNYMTADDPGSQVGDPPGSPADGGAGNANFQIAAPVVALPGRGTDLSLALVYNSHLWHKSGGNITYDVDKGWPAPGWSLGFGKMIDIGDGGSLIVEPDGTRHGYSGTISYPGTPISAFTGKTTDGSFIKYSCAREANVLHAGSATHPNGTHVVYGAPGQGAIYPTSITDVNGNFITITYVGNSGPKIETVTDTLGRVILFYYDANGLLTAVTAPGYGDSDDRQLVRLLYEQKTVGASFDDLTPLVRNPSPWLLSAVVYPATGTGYWFGEQDSYLSGYGTLAKVIEQRGMSFSGPDPQPASVGPTGQGTVTPGVMSKQAIYAWETTGPDGPTYTSLSESWAGMDTGPAVTSYEVHLHSNPRTVAVTLPDGTKTVQYSHKNEGQYNDGLVYKDETYDTDGTTLLSRSEVWWEQGDDFAPRPARMSATTRTAGGAELTTGAEFTYQPSPSFNQVIEARNYDYGYVAGGTENTLLRKTVTQYENSSFYILNHVVNLPKVVDVYAADGTTRVSRAEYTYDGAPLLDAPGVTRHHLSHNPHAPTTTECYPVDNPDDPDCASDPQCDDNPACDYWCSQIEVCGPVNPHLSWTDYRGNVTQVKTYADAAALTGAVVEKSTYDITGNLRTSSTSCCELMSVEYTLGTQYAYPTKQTRGSSDAENTAARLTTNAVYDFNTGLVKSVTGTDRRTISSTYTASTLRLQRTTLPTGAYTEFIYDDAAMTVTETTRLAPSEGEAVAAKSVTTLNGLGQTRLAEALGAGGVWDKVETVYGVMARVLKQTRPHREGEVKRWVENEYDGLGRVVKVTAPDGSVSEAFYNEAGPRPDSASSLPGETTRVRDAWGRERWGRKDAQGRLVEVVEPNPSGGGAVSVAGSLKTSYGYDTLGGLTAVTQGAQSRAFRYDSLGRLTHQKLAEQAATLNDAGEYVAGGGTWSSVFAYDARSNMIWGVDARGVKTVFDYNNDPLNRLQSVSYVVGAEHDTSSPIAPADTVFYEYMSADDVTRLWKVTTKDPATAQPNTQEWLNYEAEGRLKDRTMTVLNRSAFQLTTSYLYDTLDRVTDVTYPAQYALGVTNPARKTVHHDYDVASRLSGLKVGGVDYASGIVYNAASQTTELKVGAAGQNQVTESYDYDPVTGLLSGQKVYRGTNPEQNRLLDLAYDYLRAGTTAGRTGQLTRITNNLNAQRGRSYSYDALGRLTQAAGGDPTATPVWTQAYGYDRYGNRETVTANGSTAGLDKPREPKPAAPAVEIAHNALPVPESLRGEERRRGVSDSSGPASLPDIGPRDPLAASYVGTPSDLSVTAASASQISLAWTAAAGATNYRVERATSLSGSYSVAGTSAGTGFTDNNVSQGGNPAPAYLYRVCAADGGGNCVSPFSNLALGTAFTFTDPTLTAGTTRVKAQHFDELRRVVNSVRAAADLSAATWTDPTLVPQATTVKAVHVQELRDRLGEALQALGVSVPAYTDPTLATGAGGTPVKRVHVEQLRERATRGASGGQAGTPVPSDGHTTLAYDAATNRVSTSGWQYDDAGNQTRINVGENAWRRMEYDAAGRLVAVKTDAGAAIASNTYAATNARLIAQEGATRTYYAWGVGGVVAEYTETDGTATANSPQWAKSYIYLGGRLLATHQPNGAAEHVEYHHPDRLGTRVVTNAADTNSYEQAALPFGAALNGESTGATNRRFTSYDRSAATGLDYAVNRSYDAQQGRFTQVDPIGMQSVTMSDPQTLNLYAYCANDPVNRTDPDGLGFFGFLKKVFGAIGRALGAVVRAVAAVVTNRWVLLGVGIALAALAGFGFFLAMTEAASTKFLVGALILAGTSAALITASFHPKVQQVFQTAGVLLSAARAGISLFQAGVSVITGTGGAWRTPDWNPGNGFVQGPRIDNTRRRRRHLAWDIDLTKGEVDFVGEAEKQIAKNRAYIKCRTELYRIIWEQQRPEVERIMTQNLTLTITGGLIGSPGGVKPGMAGTITPLMKWYFELVNYGREKNEPARREARRICREQAGL